MASDTITKSAHDFSFKTIEGQHLPLSTFAGNAVLVVNTASFCGFTRQYTALQDLWQRYEDRGWSCSAFRPTILVVKNQKLKPR